MSAPKSVAIVGYSDAGKTRVVEALVREFTARGLRVGTLKHAPEHSADTPGKDTWLHVRAGARATALLTSNETAVFFDRTLGVAEAASKLGPLDLLVMEGFKGLDDVARIVVPRTAGEAAELSNGLEIAISAPSTGALPERAGGVPVLPLDRIGELADVVEARALPLLSGIDCEACGYERCGDLARAALAGAADIRRCINLDVEGFRLRVDGVELATKPFVRRVVAGALLGIIRALKGVDGPRRVELSFEVEGLGDG